MVIGVKKQVSIVIDVKKLVSRHVNLYPTLFVAAVIIQCTLLISKGQDNDGDQRWLNRFTFLCLATQILHISS